MYVYCVSFDTSTRRPLQVYVSLCVCKRGCPGRAVWLSSKQFAMARAGLGLCASEWGETTQQTVDDDG